MSSIAEVDKTRKRSRPAAESAVESPVETPAANTVNDLSPNNAPVAVYADLAIEQVERWARNPRKRFAEESLQELADSIRQLGLLEPIMVRPLLGTDRYHIVGGERRWRAAKLAGLEVVPARIFDVSEETALEMALVENLQRQDLDPIEEAEGYRALQELGYTQAQIAQRVNRSQPAVANAMRLLKLPEDVRELIRRRELTPSHGVALLQYVDAGGPVVSAMADSILRHKLPVSEVEKGMSSRVTEDLVQAKLAKRIDYTISFRDTCRLHCPHKAFIKNLYDYGVCVNQKHFRELAAKERDKARKAEEELRAKAGAAMADSGQTPQFDSTVMVQLGDEASRAPEGCSAECPCRGLALVYDYNSGKDKPTIVCTNKKRLEELRKDAQEKREQEAIAARKAHLDKLNDFLSSVPTWADDVRQDRLIRFLACYALENLHVDVKRIQEETGWLHGLIDPAVFMTGWQAKGKSVVDAENVSAFGLAKLAAACLVDARLADNQRWPEHDNSFVDYLIQPCPNSSDASVVAGGQDELREWHESMRAALDRVDTNSNLSNRFFSKHILHGAPADYTVWADVVTSMGERILELEKEAADRRGKPARPETRREQEERDWQAGMQRKHDEQARMISNQAKTIKALHEELAAAAKKAKASLSPCSECGLPPAECMCGEVQKRTEIAVAAAQPQDLTCPLCGAEDYGICKCEPDAVNAALVKDGRRAA